MSDANNIENKVDEKNPSAFEKIAQYVINFIFCLVFSCVIAFGVKYWILQLPFNLNVTAEICGIITLFTVFKLSFKKFKKIKWGPATSRNNLFDYSPGDTNDPQNPSSYATPGSPYYAYDVFERDRFHEHKSAFSDSDHYYNR
ncbi:MAG: hypothetical protein ACD_46C00098G0003 [uncultured bacterium]|nr:MAG: hypothetical protein ACD_46C00098G0003 [uncultured bacterium]